MTEKPPPQVFMINSGGVAFFENGEQVPEIQQHSWLSLWLDFIASRGYNPIGWTIRLPLTGTAVRIEGKHEDYGWFWEYMD